MCRLSAPSFPRTSNTGSASSRPAARPCGPRAAWRRRTSEATPWIMGVDPTYRCHCTHIYGIHAYLHTNKQTCTQTVKPCREYLVDFQDSIYLCFRVDFFLLYIFVRREQICFKFATAENENLNCEVSPPRSPLVSKRHFTVCTGNMLKGITRP